MEEKKQIWKVTPVLTGDFGMVRDDIKYRNGNPEIQEFVPSVLFLLESNERQIVVDTGFGDPSLCSDKFQLCVRRNRSFKNILKEASLNPEKIEAVIFMHLHWDHVGNAASFSNAVYYCQKKEWERAQDHPDEYPKEWFSWLSKNRNRVRLIQGDDAEEIFPGIFCAVYRRTYMRFSDDNCLHGKWIWHHYRRCSNDRKKYAEKKFP